MCVDKINDFYEFRLMAQNTEIQTREGKQKSASEKMMLKIFSTALGLPEFKPYAREVKVVKVEPKKILCTKFVSKYSAEDTALIDKALECYKKTQKNIPTTSKKRNERAAEVAPVLPPPKKSRKEISCTICKDVNFGYQSDLNE
jgi:hypothetical protein